ncbi:hypothetical protein A8B82_14810 [Sulfitobacter sp. EhC04]|uniref:hypothetical protein n=1 Tax=Sulfitobacter sp. EhC04 TaxID=1849168 RepID=UPI0007F49960|nr:hypothetical protein [Sulfitobacter sp. EhC04]OAN76758.1 hypothetical protein A8B82_14810 [Sulfitobacter sp. EhC04]
MNGIESIAAERKRQIEVKDFDASYDDCASRRQILKAARCYADHACMTDRIRELTAEKVPLGWPWDDEWWKPKDRRADLVRAGALIAAEIDRLDRATAQENQSN